MTILSTILVSGLISFLVTMALYPYVLRFAIKHDIVDNPSARKLQRVPIPVMGGVAVYMGIIAGSVFGALVFHSLTLIVAFTAMTIMLAIGVWDDMKDIPAMLRFIIEIFVIWAIIAIRGISINDFHGLWGIHEIPEVYSLPLSLIAGVGIINAINLIDGVDGYSSGYGIIASIGFGLVFFLTKSYVMSTLAFICACALLPFFFHNVFGVKTKMFIGDGGTLMIGTVIAIFVFALLANRSKCEILETKNFGLVPFSLALLSIPVFDTLRVMTMRILRNKSPFHPDKTHLHHIYIELGFSHIATSLIILSTNLFIVFAWFLSWKLGASIDLQFYIVIFLSLLFTAGFYSYMKKQIYNETKVWRMMCDFGNKSHLERKGFWGVMKNLVDTRWKKHFLAKDESLNGD